MGVCRKTIEQICSEHKQICVVDLSWILHRTVHVFRHMCVSPVEGTNIPTGHIYGTLVTVQTLLSQDDMGVILVRDGHPTERIELTKSAGVEYKADRPELEYDFYKDVPKIINLALSAKGVYYAYNSDKESDDVMYCIAKRIEKVSPETMVWVHSGDNDLLQTINRKGTIKVCRNFDDKGPVPIGFDEVVNLEQFTKKFHGVGPDKIVLFRSVVGDSSDNIRGIPRFPRNVLLKIIEQSSSIDDMFKVDVPGYERHVSLLRDCEQQVRVNYVLMKLRDDFEPQIVTKEIPKTWTVSNLEYYKLNRWRNFLRKRADI